jgi:HlyD family secretion protein
MTQSLILPPTRYNVLDEPEQSYRPAFLAALVTILSLVAAAGGWGMFARLDSALVTQGVLFTESQRKSIQNLEGGLLEGLLVSVGDRVTKGQVVALLDATQARETLYQLAVARLALVQDMWRLTTEAQGAQVLDPATAPPADTGEPQALRDRHVAAQVQQFLARKRSIDGQLDQLARQIAGLEAQIKANEAAARAAERQIALWQQERDLTVSLVEKGATPRQRLLELDRTLAALTGTAEQSRELILAARQDIERAVANGETLVQARQAEIAAQLTEHQRQIEDLTSRIRAAEDVLDRHAMRAPQDGVIVNITTVTPGAVVGSGTALMELVPDADRLMVLTRLPPDAIESVQPGHAARIRLTAYRRAMAPVVAGTVAYVSADLLTDPRDGAAYYEVRVSLDPADLAAQGDLSLVPGMPAEVTIPIAERRAGDYFLEPLMRHLRNAFNEE